ncbi:MAG: STAS domain-containing protein [Candidatus Cyclobacteriaceae bacterium M3_2C_046]
MIELKSETQNDIYFLKVAGEVDASSSIHLDKAINQAVRSGHERILVDCTGLNYISSAGLGVFMSYIEELKATNISMALFGLNDKVKNVFQILGLDQLLTIVDNQEQAKNKVNEL